MITLNQSAKTKQNYATWILIVFDDINNDVERWFDTSNYDENDKRPLPMGVNKKVIGMFKDELVGKIMKEFCALGAKTYAYLMDDDKECKKAKGTKNCVIKRRLMFENDLKAIIIMCIQKKSIKLHLVVMMIRDCKHLIELQHIHMEQMLLKYVKVKC